MSTSTPTAPPSGPTPPGILADDDFVRLFQQRAGLKADGWAGRDTLAALDLAYPAKAVVPQGLVVPEDYWPMLAQIESDNRPYAKASTSSASGLYQFTAATWQGEGGLWGRNPAAAFGGLTPSSSEQLARVKTFTAKNVAYLQARGVKINKATLYAAHFLGRGTAATILAAPLTARADTLAGPAATNANASVLRGKTVAQFVAWLKAKTGDDAK